MLDTVTSLNLAYNQLGLDSKGAPLPRAVWCKPEALTGWCPTGTPLAGTVARLATLNLAGNSLTGNGCVLLPLPCHAAQSYLPAGCL